MEWGVEAIKREKLLELYKNKSHCSKVTSKAEQVIDAVKGNTLLVTLIATIVRIRQYESERALQDFLDRFKILEMEEENTYVDGTHTIYERLKIVFNIAEINEQEWYAIENAILISNSGISKKEFFRLTNNRYINEIQSLINKSWIYEDELENNIQWLSIHPLVREIIYKSEKFNYKDCSNFYENLFAIVKKEKKQNIYDAIQYSENMYQIFQLLKKENEVIIWEIGYLLTEIYEETYFQYDRVFEIAFDVLNGIKTWNPQNARDKIIRCRMINGSAYSLLHTRTQDHKKKI